MLHPFRKLETDDALAGYGSLQTSDGFACTLGANLGAAPRVAFVDQRRRGKRKPKHPRESLVPLGGDAHCAAVQLMRDPPARQALAVDGAAHGSP